jgi:eukaryotic-like serine/threonine-protein kinase
MTAEEWQRVKEVFEEALGRDAGSRAAFLDQACGGNIELRARVETLLAADESGDEFLAVPAIDLAGDVDAEEGSEALTGQRLGAYQILRELGHGGMGTVYLAERADGQFRKQVAIKLVRTHLGAAQVLRRFRTERQVLADLEHPNIARLLDGGATAEGLPYLVMEHVQGERIDAWSERHKLSVRDRLRLFRKVCDAVQYAHEKQVVHRDLKPGNILVTEDGTPKLLDFGIAKVLNPEVPAETGETLTGRGAMTPEYASPEQMRGERAGPASDIYALGVMLYQLLTGRLPYTLHGCDAAQMAKIVSEQEPVKPSAAVSHTGSAARQRRELSGDLDSIVLKALRKEPGARYASVPELSADLDRFLEDLPVLAGKESFPHRAGKFLKRNRTAVVTAAVTAVLAVAFAVGVSRLSQPHLDAPSNSAAVRSIAVLPLENLSGDPEQEPLADGMTRALTSRLAGLKALRVISRDSVARFKGVHRPAAQIARELNLQALVEGTVIRSGDRVRLALELRAGPMDGVLWSQAYDRETRDLPALEGEAAKAIAQALTIGLSAAEGARLSSARIVDRRAHDAYLKGSYYLNQHTIEGFQKGLRYFKEAIDIEPAYPLAWTGLADAYYQLSNTYLPPREAMPKAKAAALKALEMEESSAEAHASLALVQAQYEWDWQAAGKNFRRALELNPGYAYGHLYYSVFLAEQGRTDEAVQEAAEARRLDPLTPNSGNNLVFMYQLAGRPDEALVQSRKLAALDPSDGTTDFGPAAIYAQQGLYDKAITEFVKALRPGALAPQSIERLLSQTMLGYVYGLSGKSALARQTLEELRQMARERRIDPFYFAIVHVGLGELDKAMEFLEKAYQERSEELLMLKVDPRLNRLRADPRFRGLVQRIGLPL